MRGLLYLILHPRRLLTIVVALLAWIAFVWVAAVHAVPAVKRRKALAREAWRMRDRTRPGSRQ